MILITDNAALKSFAPNQFTEVEGEPTLYGKIEPWLQASEEWLINEVTSDQIDALAPEESTLRSHMACAVAANALHQALPSLDLTLTPNGFAVVSTGNLAPASKERVERLRESLLEMRDSRISLILSALLKSQLWRESRQGMRITSSLFAHPHDVDQPCSYEEFCRFRDKALIVEVHLANKAVSPELMEVLRAVNHNFESPMQRWVIARIRSLVKAVMNGEEKQVVSDSLADLVQFIRSNPTSFPQWQGTDTAKLYEPPVFVNKKTAHGYWF